MLTLTCGIGKLFEKLTLETGKLIWKTPIAIACTNMSLWVKISWKVCSFGTSKYTEVRGNYFALPYLLYLWELQEQRGRGLILSREGEKPQTRGTFMGHHKKTTYGVGHWTTLSGITYYFSLFCCKNVYALHKILSY